MNAKLKWWILKKGLRVNSMFCEKLGMEGVGSLNDLLIRVKPYINYLEELLDREVNKSRGLGITRKN